MKKGLLVICIYALAGIFSVVPVLGQKSDVRGRITTGPAISLVTLAINPFELDRKFTSADSAVAESLRQILERDLLFTLYFNIVRPDSVFLHDFAGGRMSLDDWIYVGAQMLVNCRLTKNESMLAMNVEVVDVMRNRLVYSHEFLGEPGRYRYLAHRVADDLLYNLTGERGVFFSRIAYVVKSGNSSEIYICDFDGYNPILAISDSRFRNTLNLLPSWSAAGDRLFFTSYSRGNPDLYCIDFLQNSVSALSTRQGLNYEAAMSPDGNHLAAVLSFGENTEIYLIDSKSGKILRQVTFSPSIDTSPTWSPNSRQIAFTSDRSGSPQIYVTDIDGANTRRLTYLGDYNTEPAWSPRGDLVAYTSRENGLFQIYAVDITGQNTYKLTDWGSNEAPSWSPDGLHIVYTSNADGERGLWTMNFDGTGKMRLQVSGECKSPDWSPNLH